MTTRTSFLDGSFDVEGIDRALKQALGLIKEGVRVGERFIRPGHGCGRELH